MELVSNVLKLVVEKDLYLMLGVLGFILCSLLAEIWNFTPMMFQYSKLLQFTDSIDNSRGAVFVAITLITAALTLYDLRHTVEKILK